MPVPAGHRFPPGLSVRDAAGSRVALAGLRGQARAVAVSFMRTGTCPACIQHARALARPDQPTHGGQPVVAVPGPPAHAARVRRIPGDRGTVVSSAGAQAHPAAGPHRTLLPQHSGIMPAGPAGVARCRLATALPAGSFDGPAPQAATGRL